MLGREREVKLLAVSPEQLRAVGERPTMAGLPVVRVGEARQEDTYLETGDFRLFRAGLSLRYRRREDRTQVTLKELPKGVKRPLLADRMELEEDLEGADPAVPPAGEVGRRIAPLLGAEALLPLVKLRTVRDVYRVGEAAEPAAELALDRVEVLAGNEEGAVGRFFEAEVEDRGMGPERLETVGRDLLAEHGLLPSAMSKFERGLAVLGLLARARGEEQAYEVVVRRDDRLIDAAYRVFRKHFERMKRNEPGTRIGEDPEFLHDMRVSTRRLRAAFRTFKDAFRPERLAGYERDLKWIAATLGAIRDLDVYLERFPEYTEGLPDEDRDALGIYTSQLVRNRIRARTVMLRVLETKRYQRFLTRFDAFLTRGAPKRPSLPSAAEPVVVAAPLLIKKVLGKVLKKGRSISRNPAAQDLHDLRILCKRLRYTCEFFEELYRKPMRRFIRSVVELQDLLGAHQDACVASDTLRDFAGKLPARKDTMKAALTLGRLVQSQEQAAADSRAGFRKAWKAFDQKAVRRAMWS